MVKKEQHALAGNAQRHDIPRQFARNLRHEMLRAGLNFKKLAEIAEVRWGLVRRWGSLGVRRISGRNRAQLQRVAGALGLPDVRSLFAPPSPDDAPRRLVDRESNPAVREAQSTNPEAFVEFSPRDWDELYSVRGVGGPMTPEGVLAEAQWINQKRALRRKFEVVLASDQRETLVNVLEALYARTQGPLESNAGSPSRRRSRREESKS